MARSKGEAARRNSLTASHRFFGKGQQVAEGVLTSGLIGEVLGLSFHQTEKFLHDHHAPPHVNAVVQRDDVRNLERIVGP